MDHGRGLRLAGGGKLVVGPDGRGWVENDIDACRLCACCLEALDRPDEALAALFRTFAYDRPRAEICCEISQRRW